ncbi:MAG: hypothetical protein E6I91_10530 [Chloroflexi bacterium]|nr:MAG: hypothetical protein E6I91_10530 [Chloroflexota bacterium]
MSYLLTSLLSLRLAIRQRRLRRDEFQNLIRRTGYADLTLSGSMRPKMNKYDNAPMTAKTPAVTSGITKDPPVACNAKPV